jgi:hypothetical protein
MRVVAGLIGAVISIRIEKVLDYAELIRIMENSQSTYPKIIPDTIIPDC